MDETRLHGLLTEALADEPPMGPVTQSALRAGLRIRRRRRLLAAGGGLTAIAAASLGLTSISLEGGPPAPSAPAAPSPALHTIWAMNGGAGTIMQITPDGRLGRPARIGPDLSPAVFSPDGKVLALISYATGKTGKLAAVDVAAGTVSQRISIVGKYADSIAITPDDRTAYVSTLLNHKVTPYDLAKGTTGPPIDVRGAPEAIVITPDGRTMYVLSESSATSGQSEVTPIALATGQAGQPIPIGDGSQQMAISPDGKTILVGSGSVTLIDTATNTAGKPLAIGHGSPAGAEFSPDGQTAYVVDGDAGTLTPIDLVTRTAEKPIKVQNGSKVLGGPLAVAITPDGKTAYVLNPSADFDHNSLVTPVDLATGTAGKPITVTGEADSIAVSPDGQTVYAGGYHPGQLTPISTSTNQAGPIIQTGTNSTDVATGP
jgi:DNA-binding beta-propeller fold protein YncE